VVSLSAPSSQTVTVKCSTANGSAQAGSDYVALPATTLTFTPGDTSKIVPVTINGDTLYENHETLTLLLSAPTGATIGDERGVATITNDDAPPALTISDGTLVEGNSGQTQMNFTISLSAVSGLSARVSYSTVNGTAKARVSATDGDFLRTTGTLTFAPGETSKQITVEILGDTLYESDETLNISLTSALRATIADSAALGSIVNDDAPPTLSIRDARIEEGNSGTRRLSFAVELSAPSGLVSKVNWATQDGTATTGSDYAAASGTCTIAAGATTSTIDVVVHGDVITEADETFLVRLNTPINCSIANGSATGTILNDDGLVAGSASLLSQSEVIASASVSASSISLTFGDSVPAGDFAVKVNGAFVTVHSREIENNTLTLLLAEGSLQPGAQMSVTWKSGSAQMTAE
jgi:chitinase